MIDLTPQVTEIVAQAELACGLCSVYVMHATAAIVVNENDDPNVCVDTLDALDRLIPAGVWRHDKVDGNAPPTSRRRFSAPGKPSPCATGSSASAAGRPSCWSSSMVPASGASW